MNSLSSVDARTRAVLGELQASVPSEIDAACEAAASAFETWQSSTGPERARLLRELAGALETQREALVNLADAETALGLPRLNGELDRTVFQLRRFADLAEYGAAFTVVDDPAAAGGPPAGHPAMQRWSVPLGPVAIFAASNFPFAFSVLGGDTASALAAGCSVVIKAHFGHPLLSQKVLALVRDTLGKLHLPLGLVGLVQGASYEVGERLIGHPAIAAGAFTGSTRGGAALAAKAAARPRPIPFFGELGSINPIVAMPHKLAAEGPALAAMLASSIALGCGQFCTSPGVLILVDQLQPQMDAVAVNNAFVEQLTASLRDQRPHAMLTGAIQSAFEAGVEHWSTDGAAMLLRERSQEGPRPVLAQVGAPLFIAKPALREEVFGPACMVVRATDAVQASQVLQAIGGSLTATLWGLESPSPEAQCLTRAAIAIAGRVLFSGVPTGVAVTAAQQHGGPWPSSTRPDTTSVGDYALQRFLRPVCLQDAPDWVRAFQGRPV
jgi:NADP-dependent aldehyde dehydrogenase